MIMLNPTIKNITRFVTKNLEALIWIGALLYLALINPYETGHLNLCAFNLVGIESCPGCGIGRSISSVFHADILHSFQMHPLGLVALVMITFRIISIFYKNYKLNKTLLEVYNG